MKITFKRKGSVKKRLKSIERELFEESSWSHTTVKTQIHEANKRLFKLETRVSQLESIIEDAGIIEDIDMSDVKYREKEVVLENGLFGPQKYVNKIPYIVNEVKVK